MNTRRIGNRGEDLTAQYLASKGLRILHRNFRLPEGEIDLVAADGDTVVFVEVKTGRGLKFGPPQTWVHRKKQRQLIRLATHYLQQQGRWDQPCRFDVVAVYLGSTKPVIHHIPNAFQD